MPGTVDMEEVRPALMRFCMSMTGSPWDAEDLVQESLLRALPVFQGKVQHSNPEAYVMLVAKNAWRDILRRNKLASGKMGQLSLPKVEELPGASDTELAFQGLFGCLTPLQRGVYLLRDVFEYTAAEVSVQLGMTEGAVKAALHRARRELQANRRRSGEEKTSGWKPESRKELLRAYVAAFRLDDVPGILQLIQNELAETPSAAASVLNAAAGRIRARDRAGSAGGKCMMSLAA